MKMTDRDERRMQGVHADLRKIARAAWDLFDPAIVLGMPGARIVVTADGGVRSEAQQRDLIERGHSWTMDSRHLTGHAVDFAIVAGGQMVSDIAAYERVWLACWRPAGHHAGITLGWGGYWKRRDGLHVELPRSEYPV